MLKRKAIDSIRKWAKNKERKCLVVQGARQTGKTYAIERFAEEDYEELVEINFKQMPSAREIFAYDLTVDTSDDAVLSTVYCNWWYARGCTSICFDKRLSRG